MALTKKRRFEVFKRDRFACQYCGRKAPDVVLHVDHIEPKSKGGKDTLLNYITACSECNAGKGATRLDDSAAIEKQRKQLDQLAERREQLQMMVEWQRELIQIDEELLQSVASIWNSCIPGYHVNEHGLATLRKAIRKFGAEEVIKAIQISRDTYLKVDAKGILIEDSAELAFNKIYGICVIRERQRIDPDAAKPSYLRGILRNQGFYINDATLAILTKAARSLGVEWDLILDVARSARHWTDFCEQLERLMRRTKRLMRKT